MKILLIISLAFYFSDFVLAKNIDTTGAVSFISLSKGISQYSAINFYHYDIFSFQKKSFNGKSFNSGLVLRYFQTSYSYQYLPSINLSLGHIFQETNPNVDQLVKENRIFQQVIFTKLSRWFKLTHRFRFEERFIDKEDKTDFRTRLRYQIGARRALRGVEIDSGEIYLNMYNEFYFSTTGERNALFSDDWFFLGFGYMTKIFGSFEVGPLIQWSVINKKKDTRTNYALQAGWIYRW